MYRKYSNADNSQLTERELEVVKYLIQGLTNKEIAKLLVVTHHTIKAHVASVIKKMGVKNRVGITAKVLETGMPQFTPHQDSKQP